MKTILLILSSLSSLWASSQELAGSWNGKFLEKGVEYPISLEFILKTDNTYDIFSTSEDGQYLSGEKIIVACRVSYILSEDSIKLEEISVIGKKLFPDHCLQKMNLKIIRNKKKLKLQGEWYNNTSEACKGFGKISFRKRKNS